MWESDDPDIVKMIEEEEILIRDIYNKEKEIINNYAVMPPRIAPNEEILILFYGQDVDTGRVWCNLSPDENMPIESPIFTLSIKEGQVNYFDDVFQYFQESLHKYMVERNQTMTLKKYYN